ncbi:DUF5719 family protein [Leucobacter sp. GX0328]
MSEGSKVLRGTGRAAAGLVVIAAAAASLLVLQGSSIPAFDQTPPSVTVDTTQNSTQTLVCAGAYSVLGADPSRPEAAIPTGAPETVISGEPDAVEALARGEGGDAPPAAITAPAGAAIGAAQVQAVSTETAVGAVASACATPTNEQWLIGGDTSEGVSTTLSIGNAGNVPATVQIELFDENGRVEAAGTKAVLVQPHAEQIVSINGYAPERASLAVHVVSTGAPVTATLGIGRIVGLDPFGVSTVTRQIEASNTLVIPGVTHIDDGHDHGPNDVGEESELGVHVRLLNPLGEEGDVGEARILGLTKKGDRIDLGSLSVVGDAVAEFVVPRWPAEVDAIVVESDLPVVGGALGHATSDDHHDFGWFAPAPVIAADTTVAAPVVDGGELVIANPGDADAEVELAPAAGKTRTVKVAAGAAVAVDASAGGTLTSTRPVHAGVRYTAGGDIDGYPILAPAERDGSLTVYTR